MDYTCSERINVFAKKNCFDRCIRITNVCICFWTNLSSLSVAMNVFSLFFSHSTCQKQILSNFMRFSPGRCSSFVLFFLHARSTIFRLPYKEICLIAVVFLHVRLQTEHFVVCNICFVYLYCLCLFSHFGLGFNESQDIALYEIARFNIPHTFLTPIAEICVTCKVTISACLRIQSGTCFWCCCCCRCRCRYRCRFYRFDMVVFVCDSFAYSLFGVLSGGKEKYRVA